jgi:hypothetical protein
MKVTEGGIPSKNKIVEGKVREGRKRQKRFDFVEERIVAEDRQC